jgi:hypothetical protein
MLIECSPFDRTAMRDATRTAKAIVRRAPQVAYFTSHIDECRHVARYEVRYRSSAWTGLHRRPFRTLRLSRAFHHRLAQYLGIGLKKIACRLCQHSWSLRFDECEVCGLTSEERCDHSWRYFPPGVGVRT